MEPSKKRMKIFCKSQLDLLRRERLRLQLELLRLPLVMIDAFNNVNIIQEINDQNILDLYLK